MVCTCNENMALRLDRLNDVNGKSYVNNHVSVSDTRKQTEKPVFHGRQSTEH